MYKIGILIKKHKDINIEEFRLLKSINEHPDIELKTIFIDDKKRNTQTIRKGNWCVNFMFSFQYWLESLIYDKGRGVGKFNIEEKFKNVKRIDISAISPQDANYLSLDMVLNLGYYPINEDLTGLSKYGVWSLDYLEEDIVSKSLRVKEIIKSDPVTSITLQQICPNTVRSYLLDRGFYNIHWSCYKNQQCISENATEFLLKSINIISRSGSSLLTQEHVPVRESLSLADFLRYLVIFYKGLVNTIYEKLNQKILGVRYDCFTLMLGDGDLCESDLSKLKPIILPTGEFWADPFLFRKEDALYIFFEKYLYDKSLGVISCGKVKDGNVVEVKDILVKEHHLSYPHIFEEDGEIYMIPETYQAQRVEVYKCTRFPDQWELFATAFDGEEIVDTTYYKDEKGQRWLFLNKGNGFTNLYIYRIDSLKLEYIESHALNPVVANSFVGRNGGAIFNYRGEIVRPSQNNSNGIYGYGLNMNVIKKLSLKEYEEERIIAIEPNFINNINAVHHLHQIEDQFVIDVAYKRYAFPK